MFNALGLDAIILPLVALVTFGVVLLLLLRGKGPAMVGAILLVVPLPIYVSLLSAMDSFVASGAVIALVGGNLKPSEVFGGTAALFCRIQVGMLLTIPAFLLATTGLFIQAVKTESSAKQPALPAKVLS